MNLGKVLAFLQCLWAVDHSLQRASKRMLDRSGVTGPQRLALRIIGRASGLPSGRLADVLHLHPSTVTGIADRLVAANLIVRDSDPNDRRKAILRLTTKGEHINKIAEGTVESAVRKVLGKLSESQIESAHEVLNLLTAELDGAIDGSTKSKSKSKK